MRFTETMLLACTECTLYLEKREDEREYLDFTREKKLFEIIQKICLEVVDDDFDTFNDEHNERGQNAQNKHDRDRKDGGTLVVEVGVASAFLCALFFRFASSSGSVTSVWLKRKSVSLSLFNLRTSYFYLLALDAYSSVVRHLFRVVFAIGVFVVTSAATYCRSRGFFAFH